MININEHWILMTAALIVVTHKVGSTVKAVFCAAAGQEDTKKIQSLHPLCWICIYSWETDNNSHQDLIYSIHAFM